MFLVQSFLCIALIMGDGLYHFIKVMVITVNSLHERPWNGHTKKGKCALRKPSIPWSLRLLLQKPSSDAEWVYCSEK